MKINHLPALYFLHIPKTAGTSFRLWLTRLFKLEEVLNVHHLPEFENVDDDTLSRYRFFQGHFGWRMMERAQRIGLYCEAVTIFREPSDVYLSLLNYLPDLLKNETAELQDVKSSWEALYNFLSWRPLHFDEVQFSGYLDSEIDYSSHLNKYFGNLIVRFIALNGVEATPPQLLEMRDLTCAKNRLNKMRFFGMVDDWQGTAMLFAYVFCLPLRAMETRYNVTPKKKIPLEKERLRALWKVQNNWDFELYEQAKLLFSKRLAEAQRTLGVAPDAPFEAYKAPLLQRFLNTEQGIARLSNASISVSSDIIQSGFEHRFPHGEGWAIWAENLISSIYIPLAANKNLEIRFIVAVALSEQIRDQMRISVAGVLLEHKLSYFEVGPHSGIWQIHYTVYCPAGVIPNRQYTQIDFEIPELVAVDFGELKSELGFSLVGDILISEVEEIAIE